MSRIVVIPEGLRTLGAQFDRVADELSGLDGRLGGVWSGLDWEVRQKAGIEGQVNGARARASSLASQAEAMARYLATKAQAFEEADAQSASDLDTVIRQHPFPVPTPTPVPGEDQEGVASLEDAIKFLDDLLKPIDLTTKHAPARFTKVLRQIGRVLNSITGHRGHIKLMEELGGILTGATKTVGAASNLLDIRDFNRYLAGELTNKEIAVVAIKKLCPIPVLNTKIADWLVANMLVDPDGKWKGLAPSVE